MQSGTQRIGGGGARGGPLALALLLGGLCARALAESYSCDVGYENIWLYRSGTTNQDIGTTWTNYYSSGPDEAGKSITNASTLTYHGTAGMYTYATNSPASPVATNVQAGAFRLAWSSFGQPIQALLPDAYIGDVITPTTPTNIQVMFSVCPRNFLPVRCGNKANAYYEATNGMAFWIPSKGQVIAASPGPVVIAWPTASGGTWTNTVIISSVPTNRPARLFWTEKPYEAPTVDLSGLFPVIHYHAGVPRPRFDVVTNDYGGFGSTVTTNQRQESVWLDDLKKLHATDVNGIFILEYYKTGTYEEYVACEIVQVVSPQVFIRDWDIGRRLLPVDMYWADLQGVQGLKAYVNVGLNDTALQYGQAGPKDGWVFPIKKTVAEPWGLQVYWQHHGKMNVVWSYEQDWYRADWPERPQTYVIDPSLPESPRVLIPDGLSAEVMPYMEPPMQYFAKLSDSGKAFYATMAGKALLKFTTHNDIWFDVVESVVHTNAGAGLNAATNALPWPIGTEIAYSVPADPEDPYSFSYDMSYPGYIRYEQPASVGDRFNVNLYAYPTEAAPSSASRIYAVNRGLLEVWWANRSRVCDPSYCAEYDPLSTTPTLMPFPVYYPSKVAFYTNSFPAPRAVEQIAVVSGKGTDGVLTPATTYSARGMSLDGSGDFLATRTATRVPAELTLEVWFKTTTARGQLIGFEDVGAKGGNHRVYLDATGRLHYGYLLDGVPQGLTSPGAYTNGAWHHAAAAYGGGTARLLVDGVLVASATGLSGRVTSFLGRWRIGQGALAGWPSIPTSQTNFCFGGVIDEVRIWDEALPDADIEARKMRPLQGDERGLVGYYPFEDGADPVTDLSASGNPLDASGAAYAVPGAPTEPGPSFLAGPAVYYQNNPALPGYNPNEEHALALGNVVYALRTNLNTAASSDPFVLVEYTDLADQARKMKVYSVAWANELYPGFNFQIVAGASVQPPLPLAAMPPCSANYQAPSGGHAFRDRKKGWWARSAGDTGGTGTIEMHDYYAMQPSFDFPADTEPAAGTELPWHNRPIRTADTGIEPAPITYTVRWPTQTPALMIAQTLTEPVGGLPDIWNQLSVDVVYEQSWASSAEHSVTLFDPVEARGANLDRSVIDAMVADKKAEKDLTSSLYTFVGLPPTLQKRLYYDPDRGPNGMLLVKGMRIETLTGGGYLLLNLVEPHEVASLQNFFKSPNATLASRWLAAVAGLPTSILEIVPNQPYVNAALSAGVGRGAGYVTLAFNNSTNASQVPPGLPVSLQVIRVVPELYQGDLVVTTPDNPLEEKTSLRCSPDFAGKTASYEFQWNYIRPQEEPRPQSADYAAWRFYAKANGVNGVTIEGANPFTLANNYFAVRYRSIDPACPAGNGWSGWSFNLVEGWLQRAMNGINPYEQRALDLLTTAPDVTASMISQAGPPYEGPVALNASALEDAGLIQIYETLIRRAKALSLWAVAGSDAGVNAALLYAAGRLGDLYMLLGNEAYADAADPTIAFGSGDAEYGAESGSLFCFMNQVGTLLDEELALLRGRDDSGLPAVDTSPVFNRLIWNFTRGLSGGEVAYALNYNIQGDPANPARTVSAFDAKRLYPQGHGDAWGHYLSAISGFYKMLAETNFDWIAASDAMSMLGTAVTVDYYEEQKFAEAAAARARTGAEIVSRSARQSYVEDPQGLWPGYRDSKADRGWGVGEWSSRAGQGAFYDWAVCNSLVLPTVTNLAFMGRPDLEASSIERIDRTRLPELAEICARLTEIQTLADNANIGLNPLGLARGVVPFDISPAEIDDGKTHFEQIYERALVALRNAVVVADHTTGCTRNLRRQANSIQALARAATESELDYHNRLIEIYGYPYTDDVGAGKTYPEGYSGPDLVNYRIIDLEQLTGIAPDALAPMTVTITGATFSPTEDYLDYTLSDDAVSTTTVYFTDGGIQVKPSDWTGARPGQGEIQMALSDFMRAYYDLKNAIIEYDYEEYRFVTEGYQLAKSLASADESLLQSVANNARKVSTAEICAALEISSSALKTAADGVGDITDAAEDFAPGTYVGFIGPLPEGVVRTETKGAIKLGGAIVKTALAATATGLDIGKLARELQQSKWDLELELNQAYRDASKERSGAIIAFANACVETQVRAKLLGQVEALEQSAQRVRSAMRKGERLIAEREQMRQRTAQRVQAARYGDMAFRIFRNDALQKQQAAFDLAARYVYLAAKAYDYETALLKTDTTVDPGSGLLADVVRSRSLGLMTPGPYETRQPMLGGSQGDPGLCDIMARMKANWDVMKGRFGFNNPQTETSRFSLRTECFRKLRGAAGDGDWRTNVLLACWRDNLYALPEFRRYCIPFSSESVEPGWVFEFRSTIEAGRNFFGKDLSGGDHAYDPTYFATKIRSVGVWFENYTNAFGSGLANAPRVYLVLAGDDLMRSPTDNAGTPRQWKVMDQALPLPFDLSGEELNSPTWIPIHDSLGGSLAAIRRYPSLRAYHDAGYNTAEMSYNSRLIGRSVWNTRWLLFIPARSLHSNAAVAKQVFINGPTGAGGVTDIKLFFQTYSYAGN